MLYFWLTYENYLPKQENINLSKFLNIKECEKKQKEKIKNTDINKFSWAIYFPDFNEVYEIKEGTDPDILNKYCGHFEETAKEIDNVALAGHNRGYDVNCFRNLKNLKRNSKIIYKYKDKKYIYNVSKIESISDEDFSKIYRIR